MNQTFKQKAIVAGVAAALSLAGAAHANQFDASSLVTFSGKKTLVSDGTSVKQLTGPTIVESGLWQGTASVKSYVTVHFPTGLDLNGFKASANDGAAVNTITSTPTSLRSVVTAGTKYGVYVGKKVATANLDTATVAAEAAAFVYVKDVATTDSYVIAGAVAPSTVTTLDSSNQYRLTSLKSTITNTSAVGTNSLGAAAINAKAPWLAGFADGAQLTDDTVTKVGELVVNADGSADLTLAIVALDATTASDNILALPNFYASVPSGTANGDLSIVINDGNVAGANGLGVTTTTVAVAQATDTVAAVAQTNTTDTVPTVLVGTLAPQKLLPFTVKFAAADADVNSGKLIVKLNNGAKFKSGASDLTNAVTVAGTLALTGNVVNNTITPTVAADGSLEIPFHTTAAIADQDTVALTGAILDVSGVTAEGDITATITASSNVGNFGSKTLVIGKAVKGSVAVSFVDDATAGLPTVYAGRTSVTIGEGVKLTEGAPGTFVQYGSVSLAINSGAKFTASDTINSSNTTYLDNISVGSTATASLQSGIKASSASSTAQSITLNDFSFNLADATPGKLTLTVAGSAGAAGSVDLANIVNATQASAAGTLPIGVQGTSVALPDIVITEAKKGAIAADNTVVGVVAAPISQIASFDITSAKIRAYDATGAEVSTAIFGSSTGIALTSAVANSSTNTAAVTFKPIAASGANEGAVTFKITGLKATLGSSATGDLKVTIAGVSDAAGTAAPIGSAIGLTVASGVDGQIGSNVGLKITKQEVKVGSVVGTTVPSYPVATVADQTKFSLAGLPLVAAGNDQGKQGAVYVALIFQGNVFFLGNGGPSDWKQFTGGTPNAYFTGTLGTTNLDIVPTANAFDVTAAKGALFVTGYGIGIAGLSNPFDDFLKNARYNVVYTVK